MNILKGPRKILTGIISYRITKRQKFVLMSVFLTVILITTQTVDESFRLQTITFLAIATVFLSIFALWGVVIILSLLKSPSASMLCNISE